MEEQGIVEPLCSPWCAPVVLVRKKDGSTRFCVDYRKLNDVTRKDSFPLPRVDVTLDALNGAKWFSTLDLKSGYWKIELDSADKEKTAFSFGQRLWQFTVMPFGLCNAPATFERLIEAVLKGLSWDICLVYLDDIIVHTRSFDHRQSRRQGLETPAKILMTSVMCLSVSNYLVTTVTSFKISVKNKGKCTQFIEIILLKNAFSELRDTTR